MADVKFEIKEHIAVLSTNSSGWTKELNKVSWNDREAKFEIRDWAPEHEKPGRGITFTPEEINALKLTLVEHF